MKEAKDAIVVENYEKATKLLKPNAEKGIAEAQFLLGYLYFTDADVSKEESLLWLQRSAQQNHADACYYLAHHCEQYDFGTPVDEQHWELLRKAAEFGSVEAQRDLGCYYAVGNEGLEKDEMESRKWYTLAAEKGHADAQYNLGLMWFNGEGGSKDIDKAIYWFTLSASHEYWEPMSINAAEILTDIYEIGLHRSHSNVELVSYWRKRVTEIEQLPHRSHPNWLYL